jgi:hypothetical protein
MDDALHAFLDAVSPERRRRDARRMLELMSRATGEQPTLAGSGIGFGSYHYRYASGREGDAAAAGFAPRRAAMIVYLVDGVGRHQEALERLGPHKRGVGSIAISDLDAVDLDVLEGIVADSFQTLTRGVYTLRARDGR